MRTVALKHSEVFRHPSDGFQVDDSNLDSVISLALGKLKLTLQQVLILRRADRVKRSTVVSFQLLLASKDLGHLDVTSGVWLLVFDIHVVNSLSTEPFMHIILVYCTALIPGVEPKILILFRITS